MGGVNLVCEPLGGGDVWFFYGCGGNRASPSSLCLAFFAVVNERDITPLLQFIL